jgi:hypothetical protein
MFNGITPTKFLTLSNGKDLHQREGFRFDLLVFILDVSSNNLSDTQKATKASQD